jgi:di/tricarboxylate transporter
MSSTTPKGWALVKTIAKVDISWTDWFLGIMPVGVLLFVLLILEPIPAAAVGLIGVTAATVSLLVVSKPADAIKWAPEIDLSRCWCCR